MRKLIVHEFMTLDGVMQAPGGEDEDRDGGFTHGGWVARSFHEEIGKTFGGLMQGVDAFLLGRRTYLGHAGAFEPMPAGDFFGDLMNAPRKYVVSRTIEKPTWRDTTIVREDPVAFTRTLKTQPGGTILIDGSSPLVHALLGANLVDELHLTTFPLVLGQGKRVFPAGWSGTLTLEAARPYPNGAVHLHYRSTR
ncbi:MAG: dihydrofolate reductase family protein [Anaeromyxobacteraceae bacterium]